MDDLYEYLDEYLILVSILKHDYIYNTLTNREKNFLLNYKLNIESNLRYETRKRAIET